MATSIIVHLSDLPDTASRQVVFACDHGLAGLVLEFETSAFGDTTTGPGGGFVFRESGGSSSFGNLAGGKLGKGGEDELGFADVVTQVLGLKSFPILVGFHADSTAFLIDEVGEDGVFLAFFHILLGPVSVNLFRVYWPVIRC